MLSAEISGQMVALGVWLSGFVSPLDDTCGSRKGSHPHHWLQVAEMLKSEVNPEPPLQVGSPQFATQTWSLPDVMEVVEH